MKNKVTPWATEDTSKDKSIILVGGTNDLGRHGRGIVVDMVKYFGLKEGFSEGLIGNSYAFPTVHTLHPYTTYTIEELKPVVDRLYKCVLENPDKIFYISAVGCGLAGGNAKDIAPLFARFLLLDNCTLPIEFLRVLVAKVVYEYNTQYLSGFTNEELIDLLKIFPFVSEESLNKALWGNTCMVIDGKMINYRVDIKSALLCIIENRELTEIEFD